MPVKKEISPNERQLGAEDLRIIGERFEICDIRFFYLVARLKMALPLKWRGDFLPYIYILHLIDALLLRLPGMNYFAGNVVMLCRKK